jgi:hypothetical protein
MWAGGVSVKNALDAVGDVMGIRNELGRADDSRLAQPERIIWVDLPNTRKIRECTASTHYYEAGLDVPYEVSNLYDVHLRSIDVLGCEAIETRLMNALMDLGLWAPGTEWNDSGSLDSNKNVAAEQGALIRWPIRIWTPMVRTVYATATVTSVGVGVVAVDSAGNETGALP